MKKRILALILAGLLTASLASCVTSGDQDNTGGGGTEPPIGTTGGGSNPDTPSQSTWKDVDKTLYTYKTATLYDAAKVSAGIVMTLPAEAEMHCTKQNAYWSYVEYNGSFGYVNNEAATDIDLLAKKFTEVEGGKKTMYVTQQSINIRRYPSENNTISAVVGNLKWNDAVTVVSYNDSWSRIEYVKNEETKYYFVYSSYLSAEKQIDYNDPTQWEGLFVTCPAPLTRYTSGEVVNLRQAPNANATLVEELPLDTEVTVYKTAKIEESNWSYVEVTLPADKEGDPDKILKGYINSKWLSEKPSNAPASLDGLLALYSGFEALNTPKTMYAAGSTNVRSTPLFPEPEEQSNIVATLSKAEAVKVVARGTHLTYSFYVIEYTVDEKLGYYFVGASTLTVDPEGNPMITLSDLTEKYPQFSICGTAQTVTVTASKANCYLAPKSTDTPKLTLTQGQTVTLVAEETGSHNNVWWVIQTEDGMLYFVGKNLFN